MTAQSLFGRITLVQDLVRIKHYRPLRVLTGGLVKAPSASIEVALWQIGDIHFRPARGLLPGSLQVVLLERTSLRRTGLETIEHRMTLWFFAPSSASFEAIASELKQYCYTYA